MSATLDVALCICTGRVCLAGNGPSSLALHRIAQEHSISLPLDDTRSLFRIRHRVVSHPTTVGPCRWSVALYDSRVALFE